MVDAHFSAHADEVAADGSFHADFSSGKHAVFGYGFGDVNLLTGLKLRVLCKREAREGEQVHQDECPGNAFHDFSDFGAKVRSKLGEKQFYSMKPTAMAFKPTSNGGQNVLESLQKRIGIGAAEVERRQNAEGIFVGRSAREHAMFDQQTAAYLGAGLV